MKISQFSSLGAGAIWLLALAACQNAPSHPARRTDSFDRQTSQAMNPVTRQYEQQPPYGPRGNKADTN